MKTRKHTLHLREGDWDYLTSAFGPRGISTSYVVRQTIANLVDGLREKEKTSDDDIEVDVKL